MSSLLSQKIGVDVGWIRDVGGARLFAPAAAHAARDPELFKKEFLLPVQPVPYAVGGFLTEIVAARAHGKRLEHACVPHAEPQPVFEGEVEFVEHVEAVTGGAHRDAGPAGKALCAPRLPCRVALLSVKE